MKPILFAMALTAASDPHSLGLGLDVLPEAFAVAAARAHAPAALRNPRCSGSGCEWDYGADVVIDAQLLKGSLSLAVLEARGSRDSTSYRDACRVIVALVRPRDAQSVRRATVDAITVGGNDPRPYEAGVTLYGEPASTSREARCGAAAAE